jgi:hypothetical protein
MFFFSIIAAMALVTIINVAVVVLVRNYSTIMIRIFQEDIVIVIVYRVYIRSLVEESTIGINIDQCFNLLYPKWF